MTGHTCTGARAVSPAEPAACGSGDGCAARRRTVRADLVRGGRTEAWPEADRGVAATTAGAVAVRPDGRLRATDGTSFRTRDAGFGSGSPGAGSASARGAGCGSGAGTASCCTWSARDSRPISSCRRRHAPGGAVRNGHRRSPGDNPGAAAQRRKLRWQRLQVAAIARTSIAEVLVACAAASPAACSAAICATRRSTSPPA